MSMRPHPPRRRINMKVKIRKGSRNFKACVTTSSHDRKIARLSTYQNLITTVSNSRRKLSGSKSLGNIQQQQLSLTVTCSEFRGHHGNPKAGVGGWVNFYISTLRLADSRSIAKNYMSKYNSHTGLNGKSENMTSIRVSMRSKNLFNEFSITWKCWSACWEPYTTRL